MPVGACSGIRQAIGRRGFNLPGAITCFAVLAVWEVAVRGGAVTFDYLPAPSAIAVALARLVLSGQMFADTVHTLSSALIGWSAACLLGIGLGLLLGISSGARTYGMATVEVLRPMPGIAFLPLAVLLFNFSLQTELVVIVYPSLWPVAMNTMGSVMDVGARLHDVGRTLRLSRWRILAKILAPAAAPMILAGCRVSMGTALVMAVIAEMIGNPHGLGYAIVREELAFQPADMFAYIIVVGVLGIALNAALVALSRRAMPGHFGRGSDRG
ncbi:MAG TPA: ABC transporter permease [Candidatus Binataceae bacterium]|nr:ABC transporter permease [Candidatus Binataceae bacterium]